MLGRNSRLAFALAGSAAIALTLNAQQTDIKFVTGNADKEETPLPPNPRHAPLGDYVPCLFNHNEEIAMHALEPRAPTPRTIDDSIAIELYSATTAAISKFSSQPNYDPKEVQKFLDVYTQAISAENLVGLKPAEAYSKILQALEIAKKTIDAESQATKKPGYFGLLSPTSQEIDAAANVVVDAVTRAAGEVKQESKSAIVDTVTAQKLLDSTTNAIKAFQNQPNYDPQGVRDFLRAYLDYLADFNLANKSINQAVNIITEAANSARAYLRRQRELIGLPPSASTGGPGLSPQDIASAVTTVLDRVKEAATDVIEGRTAQPFQAPNDVSCSMSILGWKETSDTFGRRVANNYVAIQVTVRNLNPKNEFLIHDMQVAIDTGIRDDEFGRFQAGRDKLLVRAVAQRGQSDDRRNIILHSLEAVGAIAGSSSIAGSYEFKTAVAVFQGAFIPAFSNIFPDHTVDQLNRINDLVFSASSTSKVLVPIQGSVPLVTFITEKPLEQLPFAWCGYTSAVGPKVGLLRFHRRIQYCELDEKRSYKIDRRGRISSMKRGQQSGTAVLDPSIQPRSQKQTSIDSDQFWDNLAYSKWKARALEVLQRRTFVVIGGVHIQEVKPVAKLSNLDCPILTSGPADMSQLIDGAYTCSLTGENLGLLSSVKLEKGTDKVVGKIKAAKDGNSATLSFDPNALSDYSGVFSLYIVDSSGAEVNSGESILLSVEPIVSKSEESTLDLSKGTATLTVDGKHLDLLGDIFLVPDETAGGPIKGTVQSTGSTTVKVSFSPTTDFKSDKKYHLRYTTKADPSKQIDVKALVVTTTGIIPQGGAASSPTGKKTGGASKASPAPKP